MIVPLLCDRRASRQVESGDHNRSCLPPLPWHLGSTGMKQHDDYVSGPHHYWFQFAGGFIFGAALGAYASYRFFESGVLVLLVGVATALLFGFYCGRWGERAWHRISDTFRTWWGGP